jgi:hypothetical protein
MLDSAPCLEGEGKMQEDDKFQELYPPAWIWDYLRMGFLCGTCEGGMVAEVQRLYEAGANFIQGNMPTCGGYPPNFDTGGEDAAVVLARMAHGLGMKYAGGIGYTADYDKLTEHPEWRIHPIDNDIAIESQPLSEWGVFGCLTSPYGEHIMQRMIAIARDYDIDGMCYDFPLGPRMTTTWMCYCKWCKEAYRAAFDSDLPVKVDPQDENYRRYMLWQDKRDEAHIRRLITEVRKFKPDFAFFPWNYNGGQLNYYSRPRPMPENINRLWDSPMQELNHAPENLGASVAPLFGLRHLRGMCGDERPSWVQFYDWLQSWTEFTTQPFIPEAELQQRMFQAMTMGVLPNYYAFGRTETEALFFGVIREREEWLRKAKTMKWAALLMSYDTLSFYADKDYRQRLMDHGMGAFRAALEKQLPCDVIPGIDLTNGSLDQYKVLILPNSACLSDAEVEAIRTFVKNGGGLVATMDTSLYDGQGRAREDFALGDLFGVKCVESKEERAPFDVHNDWKFKANRKGELNLDHPIAATANNGGKVYVPAKGDQLVIVAQSRKVAVTAPNAKTVLTQALHDKQEEKFPGVVARQVGKGRVVYMPLALDQAYFNWPYPWQRELLAGAIAWAAKEAPPVRIAAPISVFSGCYTQDTPTGTRTVVHLLNCLDGTSSHGLSETMVPMREEVYPIDGITITFAGTRPTRVHAEPGGKELKITKGKGGWKVKVPKLEMHMLVVAEYSDLRAQ